MKKPQHFIFHNGEGSRPRNDGREGKTEYPFYIQMNLHSRQSAFSLLENLVLQLRNEDREDFLFIFAGTMEKNKD